MKLTTNVKNVPNKPISDLPVDSTNSLGVVARVPGSIKHHHTIGTDQIDAQAASSGRNEEQEDISIGIEFVDQLLAFHGIGAAIQTKIRSIFGPTFLLPTRNCALLEKFFEESQREQRLTENQQPIPDRHGFLQNGEKYLSLGCVADITRYVPCTFVSFKLKIQ